MTLYTLTEKIKGFALKQPNMRWAVCGDVYQLNQENDIKYPAFVISQEQHNGDNVNETFTFNLILFVVDRETSDKSNKIQVQSYGVEVLKRMVKLLEEDGAIIDQYQIQTFEEKFNDVCAGAYMTIAIKYDEPLCIEDYGED